MKNTLFNTKCSKSININNNQHYICAMKLNLKAVIVWLRRGWQWFLSAQSLLLTENCWSFKNEYREILYFLSWWTLQGWCCKVKCICIFVKVHWRNSPKIETVTLFSNVDLWNFLGLTQSAKGHNLDLIFLFANSDSGLDNWRRYKQNRPSPGACDWIANWFIDCKIEIFNNFHGSVPAESMSSVELEL